MKTLTVVIAARAAADWLEQCIESVACQKLPRGWQIYILVGIDDCPSTLAAAQRLRFTNLVVRYFPNHVGPYVVFNTLACLYPSDAFARFDADDVMLDDYLKAQLHQLQLGTTPVITQTWSVHVDSHLRPVSARLADGTYTQLDGRRTSPSDGQFLMTYAVWTRLGSFRPWWCHADSEFLRRAAWSGAVRKTISDCLYLRRVHSDSLTQSIETDYNSHIRNDYARQITDAIERYASGISPEWLWPSIAEQFPVKG